jgi:hypothetical protein
LGNLTLVSVKSILNEFFFVIMWKFFAYIAQAVNLIFLDFDKRYL